MTQRTARRLVVLLTVAAPLGVVPAQAQTTKETTNQTTAATTTASAATHRHHAVTTTTTKTTTTQHTVGGKTVVHHTGTATTKTTTKTRAKTMAKTRTKTVTGPHGAKSASKTTTTTKAPAAHPQPAPPHQAHPHQPNRAPLPMPVRPRHLIAAPPPPPIPAPPPPDPSKGSATGLALPRFAALRSDQVNLRAGPGTRYPIDWIYQRRDLPVEIEREFEVWRLVEQQDGTKGWVHQATLTGRRSFLVTGDQPQTIRAAASDSADAVAVLKPGVVGRLLKCDANADWCQVEVQTYRGYLHREAFWGTLANEAVGQ